MKTFCITSLGCKVNQYESHQIAKMLTGFGLVQVAAASDADLAIVHTCCVTHTASSKSRQMLRKQLGAGSDCKVVATGCLPDAGKKEINGLDNEVLFISKSDDLRAALIEIINTSKTNSQNEPQTGFDHSPISKTGNASKIKDKNGLSCTKSKKNSNTAILQDNTDTFYSQSRAFLKIQDGCDGFCSYCIIPKIRTKISSRSSEDIINEARQIIADGHKEIVLTGIFLGAYGQSTVKRRHWDSEKQNSFIALVDRIAQLEGLKRLRLSSLEPGDVTDELLELFKKHDNLAPHLHLSLQSGSSTILKKMNRQYSAEQFRDCIAKIKQVIDRPAITTDIIVGFPGETEDDFQQSMDMARFAGFAKIHVFSFSKRKGTAAEKMKNQIDPKIIKQRSADLSQLDKQLQDEFRKQFAGEKVSLIIENEKKQTGRCGRYFEVKLKGTNLKKGTFTYAMLENDCYHAKIIG
ncbi:MAG: tRNA (N(6)-L-threonylcarbamoyladenosine(37)-C(2))-methylthiotransferase MtaB [Sedimentisphaeraceae bacterium JB056]